MAETHDTIDGLLAEFRGYLAGLPANYHFTASCHDIRVMLDRIGAAHEREVAASMRSNMRSKLYGLAGSIHALIARSDARERGIHYTEVQNIAAQIENIADNGGKA